MNKMTSWLSRVASDDRTRFAATALVSGAVVAGAILGYQHIRRQERVEDLKASIPDIDEKHHAEKLTDLGLAARKTAGMSKEDETSLKLAERAQAGDYDEGMAAN